MGNLFTALFGKLAAMMSWCGQLFVKVFASIWDLITDVFCWLFDGLLGIASGALSSLDMSGLSGYEGIWSGASGDVLNVLGLIGTGQALGIIAAAAVIRLTLQTIPFVRWGS